MSIKFIQEWHLRSRTNSSQNLHDGGGGDGANDMYMIFWGRNYIGLY